MTLSTVTSFKLVMPSMGLSYPLPRATTIHEAKRHARMKINASDLLLRALHQRPPVIRVERATVEEWPLWGRLASEPGKNSKRLPTGNMVHRESL